MAIFDKPDQQTDNASNITTIAAGTHITGKIDIDCELHIDGEVDAEINSKGLIKIGDKGIVNSDLHAKSLVVSGKFFGNAECGSIELISGGEVEGKLTTASLTIDSSSSFQGEIIRKQPGEIDKIVNIGNEAANIFSDRKNEGQETVKKEQQANPLYHN